MNVYFLISGTLAILTSFGVLSGVLRVNKVNRITISAFLIMSCIASVFGNISILGVGVSINFLVYLVFFALAFFRQSNIKNYLNIVLASLVIIAVMMCYNAINLSKFEFSLIQPYMYVSVALGIVIFYICPNVKSAFCGVFLGSVCSELLFHELSVYFINQSLFVGGIESLTITFITIISFCLYATFAYAIKAIAIRKKEKAET